MGLVGFAFSTERKAVNADTVLTPATAGTFSLGDSQIAGIKINYNDNCLYKEQSVNINSTTYSASANTNGIYYLQLPLYGGYGAYVGMRAFFNFDLTGTNYAFAPIPSTNNEGEYLSASPAQGTWVSYAMRKDATKPDTREYVSGTTGLPTNQKTGQFWLDYAESPPNSGDELGHGVYTFVFGFRPEVQSGDISAYATTFITFRVVVCYEPANFSPMFRLGSSTEPKTFTVSPKSLAKPNAGIYTTFSTVSAKLDVTGLGASTTLPSGNVNWKVQYVSGLPKFLKATPNENGNEYNPEQSFIIRLATGMTIDDIEEGTYEFKYVVLYDEVTINKDGSGRKNVLMAGEPIELTAQIVIKDDSVGFVYWPLIAGLAILGICGVALLVSAKLSHSIQLSATRKRYYREEQAELAREENLLKASQLEELHENAIDDSAPYITERPSQRNLAPQPTAPAPVVQPVAPAPTAPAPQPTTPVATPKPAPAKKPATTTTAKPKTTSTTPKTTTTKKPTTPKK